LDKASYVLSRVLLAIPTLLVISLVSFWIVQSPPGEFQGAPYRLPREPFLIQYLKWVSGFLRGDFGYSLTWHVPVRELVGGRLLLTTVISLAALLFTFAVAVPAGVFCAVRRRSIWDYGFTLFGSLGLAIPNFLLALLLMYAAYAHFGIVPGSILSPDMVESPWSGARVLDLLQHLWVPVLVVGMAHMCAVLRTVRANLLDELPKEYVAAARTRGLSGRRLIWRYPVRVAMNPIVSTVGWLLPAIVSGETLVAVVLGLPTIGPLLLDALLRQDTYLAGAIVMLLAFLTVIGTLLSDLLLAWVDPRIRL
jgi:peptide/nickel transport system permease protein